MSDDYGVIVIDTSVLINFLNLNQIHRIAQCFKQMILTDHVVEEVTLQKVYLAETIKSGLITVVSLNEESDINQFLALLKEGRLGVGECSAIAYAMNHSYTLGIDDKQAIRAARRFEPAIPILGTFDIFEMLFEYFSHSWLSKVLFNEKSFFPSTHPHFSVILFSPLTNPMWFETKPCGRFKIAL
ncbi:MAG: hypothetical protein IPK86_01220 [Neisseriales bacterium]|nr:MAG: hypothetical protein IPK86_01220 [Neisseriales bacterium]